VPACELLPAPKSLQSIRQIRVRAVGHPTDHREKQDGKKQIGSSGISRHSLTSEGFTLYSFDIGSAERFQSVQVRELITEQRRVIVGIVEEMIALLAPRAGGNPDDPPGTAGDPQSDDPEAVARWIAEFDAIPPLRMTPAEEAAWRAARETQKHADVARVEGLARSLPGAAE
jgi:hypothetical protein